MKMVDRSGNVVDVPDSEAAQAFQAGTHGFIPGTDVPVVGADGSVGTVKAEQAPASLANGARVADAGEVHQAQLDSRYGGITGTLAAGGESLARGATLGLSDAVASAVGGRKVREHLAGEKEAHPYVSGAGEIAGAVLPSLLAGPEAEGGAISGLAKTLGAPARALSEAGHAVGALAPELGESLGARLATKAVQSGLTGATEGALFGAGNEISEDALGDHKITAEKLMAAMGHTALMGGLFGAGLGVAGEALGSGAKYAASVLSPKVANMAEDQMVRSLMIGSDRVALRRMEALPGGSRAIGRRLIEDGIPAIGDTVDTLAPKVEEGLEKAGAALQKIRGAADAAGLAGPEVEVVADRMRREMLAHVEAMPETNAGSIATIKGLANDFVKANGGPGARASFTELARWRGLLDDKINFNPMRPGAPINIPQEALKNARSIVEDELEKHLDIAAKELGGDILPQYKDAKLRYRQYRQANDAVQEAVLRKSTNRVISPTDYLTGIAGAAGSMGHPVGAATGIASALVHKAVREKGNATAAVLLDRLSSLGAVSKSVASLDSQIDEGVASLFKEKKALPKLRVFAPQSERYDDEVKKVQAMRAAPSVPDTATKPLTLLTRHAPNIATSVTQGAQVATAFLASKIPTYGPDPSSLTPHLKKVQPNDFEKAKFLRYANAVEQGPKALLAELKAGRVNRETVETMEAVYPETYAEVQKKIMGKLSEQKAVLPYADELQLRIVFGLPVGAPGFVQAQQNTYAPANPPGPPQPGKPLKGPKPKAVNTDTLATALSLPLQGGA
jgi:hypothetical protein